MKTKTTKHTPGEWQIIHSNDPDWHIESTTGYRIATVKMGSSIDRAEFTEANARLIAAAPQLLEALQVCIGQLESVQLQTEEPLAMPWPSIEQARAASAKATGE